LIEVRFTGTSSAAPDVKVTVIRRFPSGDSHGVYSHGVYSHGVYSHGVADRVSPTAIVPGVATVDHTPNVHRWCRARVL
jgi:hypothetical protein